MSYSCAPTVVAAERRRQWRFSRTAMRQRWRSKRLCPSFAAWRLTPRSTCEPTACHQARATVQACIFCSAGLASYRRLQVSSNVRQHNREQRHVSISTNANANTNSVLSSGSPEFQPQHATCLCRGLSHRMLRPQCCLTPRSRRGPTSKRQARAVGWRIFHRAGLAFCCRSRLSSNVRPHTATPLPTHAMSRIAAVVDSRK